MKIDKLENFDFFEAEAEKITCDLFVVFMCEEARSSYIVERRSIQSKRTWVIDDSLQTVRFEGSGGEVVRTKFGSQTVSDFIGQLNILTDGAKVVLDISCMPREVMAEISYQLMIAKEFREIEVVALYSLAKFTFPVENEDANEGIEPVHPGYAGWSAPETKPTSLVLGLGYELHRAEGASEYFEPKDQWVFVPHSPIDEFLFQVNKNNSNLLDKMEGGHLIAYRVDDPEVTYGQLELVVSSLLKTSNPVLLPFGPKIFFFLCLVQCVSHPELGVWLVTGSEKKGLGSIEASGIVVGVRCKFSSEH